MSRLPYFAVMALLVVTYQSYGVYACQTEIFSSVYNVSSSLAIVNGRPAVVYFEIHDVIPTAFTLTYKRALDQNGLLWPSSGFSFDTGNRDADSSLDTLRAVLRVVDGRPTVFSVDIRRVDGDPVLKYYRSADADGTNWNEGIIFDSLGVTESTWHSTQIDMIELEAEPRPLIMCWTIRAGNTQPILFVRRADTSEGMPPWSFNDPVYYAPVYNEPLEYGRTRFSLAILNGLPTVLFINQQTNALLMLSAKDVLGDKWEIFPVNIYEEASAIMSNPILLPMSGSLFAALAIEDFVSPMSTDTIRLFFGNCATGCQNFTLSSMDHVAPGSMTSLAATLFYHPIHKNVIAYQYSWFSEVDQTQHVYLNFFHIDAEQIYETEVNTRDALSPVIGQYASVVELNGATYSMWYGGDLPLGGVGGNSLVFNSAAAPTGQSVGGSCVYTSVTTPMVTTTTAAILSETAKSGQAASSTAPTTPIAGQSTEPTATSDQSTGSSADSSTPTTPIGSQTSSIGGSTAIRSTLSMASTAGQMADSTTAAADSSMLFVYIGVGVVVCVFLLVGIAIGICVTRRRGGREEPAERRSHALSDMPRQTTSLARRGTAAHGSRRSRSRRRSGAVGASRASTSSRSQQSRASYLNRVGAAAVTTDAIYAVPVARLSAHSSRRSNQDTYVTVPKDNYIQLRSMAAAAPSEYTNAPAQVYSAAPAKQPLTAAYQSYGNLSVPSGQYSSPAATSEVDMI